MGKIFSLQYGAKIQPDDDGFLVTFRDIENAFTWSPTYNEAIPNAREALDLILLDRLDKRKEIPTPSRLKKGEIPISPSPDVMAPILLNKVRNARHKTMAEVAKKMKVPYQSYQRMETGKNLTLKSFKKAAAAIGSTVEISLRTNDTQGT